MTRKILQEIIFIILRVAFVFALIYAGYSCISTCYSFGYKIFADEAKDPEPGIVKTVAIVEGKTDKEIGEVLAEKGLVDSGLLFMFQVKFSDYDGQLRPGVYELSTAMTPYEMMAVMSAAEESEVDEDAEDYVPTKSEATLWDEADDTVKDDTENREGNDE